MRIRLEKATMRQAPALAALRLAVAEDLTSRFGKGAWSSAGTVKSVLYAMRTSSVFVATRGLWEVVRCGGQGVSA